MFVGTHHSIMDGHCDILQTLKENKSDVTCCDFGGNYLLAIGSSDKSVRILEWKIGLGFVDMSYSPLQHHKYGVNWVRFSPQGTMVASSSVDGTTILWNVKTGTKIHTMVQATKSSVRRCDFTPDSTKLITAGDDGVFCFWDLVHRTLIRNHCLHNGELACIPGLAISPDSEYLLTGDTTGLMKLWPLSDINDEDFQPLLFCKNVHDGINGCEFSGNLEFADIHSCKYVYSFATCGADGLINLWSLEVKGNPKESSPARLRNCSMKVIRSLSGHENDVLSICFNLNGSLLASTGLDKTVRLWEVDNGECIKKFTGHSRYVNCCAFSKNSALLATGSNDKTVIIWDLNRNLSLDSQLTKKCTTSSHFSGVRTMTLLAEELVIHQLETDANRPELMQTLSLTFDVNTAHFYKNDLLAVAGRNKAIFLWRRKPGESAFVLDNVVEDRNYINQVEISPCGTKLMAGGFQETVNIWNLQTEHTSEMESKHCMENKNLQILTSLRTNNSIRTCRFSPNSELIAVGGNDDFTSVWDAKNFKFIQTIQVHKEAVTSVAFSADSKLVASTSFAGDLKIYNLETDRHFGTKELHDLGATCCDFSGAENKDREYTLATCGYDSIIKVSKINLNNIKELKKLSGHGGNVTYVRFSPKIASLLASCATDCTIRLWNVDSGECLHVFDHHGSIVTTCTFSHDSSLLATGSLDKKVFIWTLPYKNDYEQTICIEESKKLLQHWSNSDVVDWLNELGFNETSYKVKNTSLNGQQLLGLKINSILDLIGIDGEERKAVGLHIYWLKNETKRSSINSRLKAEAPHQFLCPITHEIMTDPVICSDGFTYERSAITEWLLCGKCTSPMTNEPLRDLMFIPNITLKTNILKYLYGEEIKD